VGGVELAVEGPCRGGEVGAAYVRWPDGRRSVLTGGTPTAAALVELARAGGLPVARYELAALVDETTYVVVQELLPGYPPDSLDQERLRAFWAHMSLRLVDWAIRHHTRAEVELWLDTAELGIRALC
jgi:hypothetical protein